MSKDFTKFIIVGHPRSGSANLCEMLNATPSVKCGREILNGNPLRKAGFGTRINNETKLEATREFLTTSGRHHEDTHFAAVGFKAFPWHLDLKTLNEALASLGVLYIYLKRPCLWESSISYVFAKHVRKCHVKLHEDIRDFTEPVHIPKDRYLHSLRRLIRCHAQLDMFFKKVPHFKIEYSEGVYLHASGIFKFLGVEEAELVPQRKRINTDNFYTKYVTNYDSLRAEYERITNSAWKSGVN